MCSWSGSKTHGTSSTPASEEGKLRKRRRAFCLARMKSRNSSEKHQLQHHHEPAANNNNNTPFMIHCKEIKHICSNCRGAEPLDGETLQVTLRAGGGGEGEGGVRLLFK